MCERLRTAKPCAARAGAERSRGPLEHPPGFRPLYRRAGTRRRLPADRRGGESAGELRGVTKVRFLKVDGSLDKEVEAPTGSVLLDVAQEAGEPLEGACE